MGAYNIPLEVMRPQFTSPITAATQALNLRHLAGSVDLQKQIAAENQLKIQAQQEDENDQKTIQDAFNDPANMTADGKLDFDKFRATVAPKVRLRNLQALDADHQRIIQGALQMDKNKQQLALNNATLIGNELLGYKGTPAEQREAAWSGLRTRLANAGIDLTKYTNLPEQAPDDPSTDRIIAGVGYAKQALDLANKQALEDERKATEAKRKADAALEDQKRKDDVLQKGREDIARMHEAVTDQPTHDKFMADIAKKYPDLAPEYSNLTQYNDKTKNAIQRMALTPAQKATVDNRLLVDDATQRRLDILQQRADAYDQRVEDLARPKGASPGQFRITQQRKDRAILQSNSQLDAELARIQNDAKQKQVQGKLTDDQAAKQYGEATKQAAAQAWQNHLDRLKQIQQGYEDEISGLIQDTVPHNDWADKLNPPEFDAHGFAISHASNTPPPKPAAPKPVEPKLGEPVKPQATPAAQSTPQSGYVRYAVGAGGHRIGQKPDGTWWDVQTNQVLR